MSNHALSLMEQSIRRAKEKQGEEALAEELFRRFFDRFPETRTQFFTKTDLDYFGVRKFDIIVEFLLDTLKHPNFAEGNMCNEMMRHQVYGLNDKAYYLGLIDSLMESVQAALGDEWTDQLAEHWNDTTNGLKAFVHEGAAYL